MKSTGIVRKVDELGRIVIPIELRRTLDIGIKDSLEIYVEDDRLFLRSICLLAHSATTQATSSSSRARTSVQSALPSWLRISRSNTYRAAEKRLFFCQFNTCIYRLNVV